MGRADYYAPGDWNAQCDFCGRKMKASTACKTWNGFRVCPDCIGKENVRHPQDLVRGILDQQAPPWTRPEGGDVFIASCTLNGQLSIAGYAVAGCWVAGRTGPIIPDEP